MRIGQLLSFCSLAFVALACGSSKLPGGGQGGTLELKLGSHDAWPTGVASARIVLNRTGGTTGCGAALATVDKCWCTAAGAGCDFAGSPNAPLAAINNLCSGNWTLDTTLTNAFQGTACTAATVLT